MDPITQQPTSQIPQPQAMPPVQEPSPTPPQMDPPQQSSKNPLLYVGFAVFFVALLGMTYYLLMPKETPQETTSATEQTTTYIAPTAIPTAVPLTAEEQEVEAAVTYSLEETFAELEKDLQELE